MPRQTATADRTLLYPKRVTDLAELGWDEGWRRVFDDHAPTGTIPARVTIEFNHIYRVVTSEGELQAQLSGRLRHQAMGRHELAAVGDWVAVELTPNGRRAQIHALLPRRTRFSRQAAGQAQVEPRELLLLAHAQADEEVHDLEDGERGDARDADRQPDAD